MKVSVHQVIRGKPAMVENLSGRTYMESQGQEVNLGYNWLTVDLDWPSIFELITVDGCATSAELTCDNRKDANFVSRELLMVDIDSGMTIPELFNDDFYNLYGAGFYATPSHTLDHHRFRIMFRTETPITDNQRVKQTIMALMRLYDHADIACKDSTRIFYGTINCEYKKITTKVLPDQVIDVLVAEELRIQAESRPSEVVEYPPATTQEVKDLADQLKQLYPELDTYALWTSVCWAFCNTVGYSDGIQLMKYHWPEKVAGEYDNLVSAPAGGNRYTIGTVRWLIAQRSGRLTESEILARKILQKKGIVK